jgi:hypothetical protein
MREKRLRNGRMAYFWEPPSIYVRQGFSGRAEALGTLYSEACERAQLLNVYLDEWRTGRARSLPAEVRRGFASVGWLFDRYLRSPAFEKRVSKRSQYEYRRALARIEDISTTMGAPVAELRVDLLPLLPSTRSM